jgi:acyl-CoA thioester hydrolase
LFIKNILQVDFYENLCRKYFGQTKLILFYNPFLYGLLQYTTMFSNSSHLRIRYSETDQMGYCYYGNYAQFFEIGRVETLREIGVSYKSLEERGIMLPVVDLNVKYLRPALYDDLIEIKTFLKKVPGARIEFDYEIYNEKKELLTTASTTLVFISSETMKPIQAPEDVKREIERHLAAN